MKITLANGTELQPLMVTGAKRTVQGANRDCLTFVFDGNVSLDEMDAIFTDANCEVIKIIDTTIENVETIDEETGETVVKNIESESEAIYTGYTIRAELKKADVVAEPGTEKAGEVTVKRVTVSMAQRTYAETQMAEHSALLNELLGGN